LFGSQGSNHAGIYFIALTISTGITSITYSLFTIGLPTLSAMRDGRKRLAWHIIRLSLIISLPLSSSLIFYSKEIMQLIGQDYIEGSVTLQILLSALLPTSVLTGIEILVYSYGNYRKSLVIGLATNVPRTILYFILVPIYGSAGAALSYTAGSMMGFMTSVVIGKRIRLLIDWKSLILILIIPVVIAFILHYFHVNYIIGIVTTIIISYLLLLKLQIITMSDLRDSVEMLPYSISNPTNRFLDRVDKRLSRFYS
jgi:O-antigen/teichoic acid export membrane protein